MQSFRRSGTSIWGALSTAYLRKKTSNSWSAIQDTYFSTKDIFERHRVVFTISTSIASVATAWAGYSFRHLHQARVEERLQSIEQAMRSDHHLERAELKKIVNSGNVTTATCVATTGTALVIGYGLGWRGGKWYTTKKFRKEQMKLLGTVKPRGWQFLKRPLLRAKAVDTLHKFSNVLRKDHKAPVAPPQGHTNLANGESRNCNFG